MVSVGVQGAASSNHSAGTVVCSSNGNCFKGKE
jgi:hypothetical protein